MAECVVCGREFEIAGSWSTGAGLIIDRGGGEDHVCGRCVRCASLHAYLRAAWVYSPDTREALELVVAGQDQAEAL